MGIPRSLAPTLAFVLLLLATAPAEASPAGADTTCVHAQEDRRGEFRVACVGEGGSWACLFYYDERYDACVLGEPPAA